MSQQPRLHTYCNPAVHQTRTKRRHALCNLTGKIILCIGNIKTRTYKPKQRTHSYSEHISLLIILYLSHFLLIFNLLAVYFSSVSGWRAKVLSSQARPQVKEHIKQFFEGTKRAQSGGIILLTLYFRQVWAKGRNFLLTCC